MRSSDSIDLVKAKPNLIDELVKWALTFGRLLIIIVEIVAFSAFIYRFALDRKLVDLNDKIKNEQAIIASTRERENIYRSLQERITTAEKISTTGNTNIKLLNDIVSITPAEITYNSFSVENNNLNLEVDVASIPRLTEFLKQLREFPQIISVGITGIDNSSGTNTVKVSIVAKLKGAE